MKFPFESTDAKTLFPNIYDGEVTLGKMDWTWGDLPFEGSLILFCLLARNGYTPIAEFGTFRGRTTYNLALNSDAEVTTIDIGSELGQLIDVGVNIEKHGYPSYKTGEIFLNGPASVRSRIKQITGDSTKLDLSHLYGKMGMVIVDGGHSYEVCKSDSEKALRMVREGGVVIWDDYSTYWPGVKQALDELSASIKLSYLPRESLVVHIAGRNGRTPADARG
jgi:Methyltransferase domain